VSLWSVFHDDMPMELLHQPARMALWDAPVHAPRRGELAGVRLAGAEILHRFGGVFVEPGVRVAQPAGLRGAVTALVSEGIAFSRDQHGRASAGLVVAAANSDGTRAWLVHLATHVGAPTTFDPNTFSEEIEDDLVAGGWELALRLGDYRAGWRRLHALLGRED